MGTAGARATLVEQETLPGEFSHLLPLKGLVEEQFNRACGITSAAIVEKKS